MKLARPILGKEWANMDTWEEDKKSFICRDISQLRKQNVAVPDSIHWLWNTKHLEQYLYWVPPCPILSSEGWFAENKLFDLWINETEQAFSVFVFAQFVCGQWEGFQEVDEINSSNQRTDHTISDISQTWNTKMGFCCFEINNSN